MTAHMRWGMPAMIVVLAVTGCSGQTSSTEPSSSGSIATQPAPVSSPMPPAEQPPVTQPSQVTAPAAPVAPNAGTQPGWPIERACEAGAKQLKLMFPDVPGLTGADSVPPPPQPGANPAQPGAFGCTYGSSGGIAAGARFSELYIDPAQNPDFIKVCDLQRKSLQWSVIAYAPAIENGWAAYGLPELREGYIQSALCGNTFTISVTLTDIPGASYQNALDLAMAMVNH